MLGHVYFGNSVKTYLIACGAFLGALLLLRLLRWAVLSRLQAWAKRTETLVDDFLVGLLKHLGPLFYLLIAIYLSSGILTLPSGLERAIQIFFVVVLTFKAVRVLQEVSGFFLKRWADRAQPEDPTSAVVVENLSKVVRVFLWVAGVIFILDNLGINVTSIIAGLGIGGIAVALAAQAVLGDAFSAFAIFMDKPFRVGDFVIVGDLLGTVEHIGFKTTRVRSVWGEEVGFSNTDLTNSRIKNYKQMQLRRIIFKFGVTYQTPLTKLKQIPKLVEAIIKEIEGVEFMRAHFKAFGDYSLDFEALYTVLSPDYNRYMDVQQQINFRLAEEFQKLGVEFAYPTQTLFVSKQD